MSRQLWAILLLFVGGSVAVGCRVQTASAPDRTALPAATETAVVTPTSPPTTAPTSAAADADVTFVDATETSPGVWTFSVTVAHPDTGWEDYADGWDVVLPDGTVVKASPDDPFTRLLLHPHENEQPFTRSQSGIEIPAGVEIVTVRAHDLVDGFGGREIRVDVTATTTTDDYSVTRLDE